MPALTSKELSLVARISNSSNRRAEAGGALVKGQAQPQPQPSDIRPCLKKKNR